MGIELVGKLVFALLGDLKTEAISDIKNKILGKKEKEKLETGLKTGLEKILIGEQGNPYYNKLSKMIVESEIFYNYIDRRLNGDKALNILTRVEDWTKSKQYSKEETKYLCSVAERLTNTIDECLMINLSPESRLQCSFFSGEMEKNKKEIIDEFKKAQTEKTVVYNVNTVNNTYVTTDSESSESKIVKRSINLAIGLYENEICLSPESIQTLKDYYLLDKEEKKNGVKVNIDIIDFESMALHVRKIMGGSEQNTDGLDIVRQKLSTRIKGIRKSIENAIQCMLDYSESSMPESYNDLFIKMYGDNNFIYRDEFSVECYYSEVYYWVTLSNIIIKEQIIDFIANSNKFNIIFKVDFVIPSLDWYFTAAVPEKYKKLELLSHRDATIADFDNRDLLLYVYPQMYFSVGRMLDGKDGISSETLKNNVQKLVNPLNYFAGLH